MKQLRCILLLIVIIGICPNALAQDHLENLSFVKQRLAKYHDSGEYYSDILFVARHALSYLRFRINQNKESTHPKKLAIVFDIDETSLSNYQDMKALDFGGSSDDYIKAEEKSHDPAIPSILTLYQYAKNNNVAIFFITERKETLRKATINNLKTAGYDQWKYLYMKPNDYKKSSIVTYKSSMRRTIKSEGYDIVINIGDQKSDLDGGFADMSFKVPDPYYFVS